MLPITAKLNPLAGRGRNLAYLAEVAVLTRLATGVTRVWQNRPSKQKDPSLSPAQKLQPFGERFFVEIPGSIFGAVLSLHFGQDAFSKFFESRIKPLILRRGTPGLTETEITKTNQAIRDVYGASSRGMIHRVLYGEEVAGQKTVRRASLAELEKQLEQQVPGLFEKVLPHVQGFAKRLNRAASLSVLGGVVLSAVFGGLVTQWANDWMVAPALRKFFGKTSENNDTKSDDAKNGNAGRGLHVHHYHPPQASEPPIAQAPPALAVAPAVIQPAAFTSLQPSPPKAPIASVQTFTPTNPSIKSLPAMASSLGGSL